MECFMFWLSLHIRSVSEGGRAAEHISHRSTCERKPCSLGQDRRIWQNWCCRAADFVLLEVGLQVLHQPLELQMHSNFSCSNIGIRIISDLLDKLRISFSTAKAVGKGNGLFDLLSCCLTQQLFLMWSVGMRRSSMGSAKGKAEETVTSNWDI